MQEVISLGTKIGITGKTIKLEMPFLFKNKREIVELAMELKAPLHLTWSCYCNEKKACGECDACLLRLKAFEEAGLKDPIEYVGS